jgi:triacylglycerol lipase
MRHHVPADLPPVLLVHGIWNTGEVFARLGAALCESGERPLEALDLEPNDGSAPLETLAEQLIPAAQRLRALTADGKIDVVGFSMGALVGRYWLQRLGGKDQTRRFISISGPHAGTLTAWCSVQQGVHQMRPGSLFLRDLARDAEPFGEAQVHTLSTPLDLMIVPSHSSRLPTASSHTSVPVVLHRWMLTDPRVLRRVSDLLSRDTPPDRARYAPECL